MDYRIAIIIPNTPAFETAKKLLEKKNLNYPLYKASGSEAVDIASPGSSFPQVSRILC